VPGFRGADIDAELEPAALVQVSVQHGALRVHWKLIPGDFSVAEKPGSLFETGVEFLDFAPVAYGQLPLCRAIEDRVEEIRLRAYAQTIQYAV